MLMPEWQVAMEVTKINLDEPSTPNCSNGLEVEII